MLTAIVLRDDELATLSRSETLALDYLLHERLSEIARGRRSGDSALLLAIKAADYLAPLLDELGDDGTYDLLDAVAASDLGCAALDRARAVAALTANAA
ncbi:MAG TPA: hypothetical protein VGX28_14095 [Frankiaceae bacterium]|jgi:hypothetical protein|nr:hypothetical protein [Frankiaceae bacterium]